MGANAAKIDYVATADLLSIWPGGPDSGGGYAVTFKPDFDTFYSEDDGKCVGVYLFDAARILLPQLTQEVAYVEFQYQELRGSYSREIDTLVIGDGTHPATGAMSDGIMAHYNDEGLAVSFTLKNVSQWLLPRLRTWRGADKESERS